MPIKQNGLHSRVQKSESKSRVSRPRARPQPVHRFERADGTKPVRTTGVVASRGTLVHRDSGSEYLGSVITSGSATGSPLLTIPITPNSLTGGRLAMTAHLWEKWKIHKLVVRYVPIVGTATDGQLVMYIDKDPADAYPTTGTDANIRDAFSTAGCKSFAVSQTCSVEYKTEKSPQLWTSPASSLLTPDNAVYRQTEAGTIVVLAGSVIAANTVGMLYIDYDIEWADPQVAEDITLGGGGALLTKATVTGNAYPMGDGAGGHGAEPVLSDWSQQLNVITVASRSAIRLFRGVYNIAVQLSKENVYPGISAYAGTNTSMYEQKFSAKSEVVSVNGLTVTALRSYLDCIVVVTGTCGNFSYYDTDATNYPSSLGSTLRVLKMSDAYRDNLSGRRGYKMISQTVSIPLSPSQLDDIKQVIEDMPGHVASSLEVKATLIEHPPTPTGEDYVSLPATDSGAPKKEIVVPPVSVKRVSQSPAPRRPV